MGFDPLDHPCHRCHVAAGQKCQNYLGMNKQPCPDRGKAPERAPRKPVQLGLFDQQGSKEEEE